jgi:hypothetical protein
MPDPKSPFKKPLAELENAAHVPVSDQTEEQPDTDTPSSAWAWDEERRQARLAGGA